MQVRDNLFLDRLTESSSVPNLRGSHGSLFDRAALLDPKDQLLLELAIKNQLSCRQLSRVMSVPAGTICRRLRRLINRLRDPLVVALLQPTNPLPPEYRQVAIEHLLLRKSMRQLSDLHRIPRVQVRQMLEHVRGWHRATGASMPRR